MWNSQLLGLIFDEMIGLFRFRTFLDFRHRESNHWPFLDDEQLRNAPRRWKCSQVQNKEVCNMQYLWYGLPHQKIPKLSTQSWKYPSNSGPHTVIKVKLLKSCLSYYSNTHSVTTGINDYVLWVGMVVAKVGASGALSMVLVTKLGISPKIAGNRSHTWHKATKILPHAPINPLEPIVCRSIRFVCVADFNPSFWGLWWAVLATR